MQHWAQDTEPKLKTKQKIKKASNTDPRGWVWVLAKGKKFLFLGRHLLYYSYSWVWFKGLVESMIHLIILVSTFKTCSYHSSITSQCCTILHVIHQTIRPILILTDTYFTEQPRNLIEWKRYAEQIRIHCKLFIC